MLDRKSGGKKSGLAGLAVLSLLLFGAFLVPHAAFAQTPQTLVSANPQANGLFGFSSAISGNTVVVGAYRETASGDSAAGNVYVFSASTGALVTTLTSPNPIAFGSFGFSVAVSGSYIVVGAPEETASGDAGAGHVYIYSVSTDSLLYTISSPNPQKSGLFGWSVGATDSSVIVGAYKETDTINEVPNDGDAYVFSASTGSLVSTLITPNPGTGGRFGYSVALSGTNAVVGAPYETGTGGTESGNAYVFNSDTGGLTYTLSDPNSQAGGNFGWSAAVNGTTAVVGALSETASGDAGAGNAYVFNAGTGALISTLTSPNPVASGNFGRSVGTNGTSAVVGAPDETASGDADAGNAYLYNPSTGALVSTLASPNVEAGAEFGISVSVSGMYAVVGCWAQTVSGDAAAGSAYVFTTSSPSTSTSTPTQTSTVTVTSTATSVTTQDFPGMAATEFWTTPNPASGGYFGAYVASSGNYAVVGAFKENGTGANDNLTTAGNAYVYNVKTGALVATLSSPNAQDGGHFGEAVAIDGGLVVVGAQRENSTASNFFRGGHAYVFSTNGRLLTTLTSPNAQPYGLFGESVAITGNEVVVGAGNENVSGLASAGNAYVFNAHTGKLLFTLTDPNPQAGGTYGYSVAASHSYIVVGTGYQSPSGIDHAGEAYVYSASTGKLLYSLTSPNEQVKGFFGNAVALNGTAVVVGAPFETSDGQALAGNAYVFNATDGALLSALTSPNAQPYGVFGVSVAASGDSAIVGALEETGAGNPAGGNAYVFNAGTGTLNYMLTSPNAQFDGYFGIGVAIGSTYPGGLFGGPGFFGNPSGAYVIVGADDETGSGVSGAGNAYVFTNFPVPASTSTTTVTSTQTHTTITTSTVTSPTTVTKTTTSTVTIPTTVTKTSTTTSTVTSATTVTKTSATTSTVTSPTTVTKTSTTTSTVTSPTTVTKTSTTTATVTSTVTTTTRAGARVSSFASAAAARPSSTGGGAALPSGHSFSLVSLALLSLVAGFAFVARRGAALTGKKPRS